MNIAAKAVSRYVNMMRSPLPGSDDPFKKKHLITLTKMLSGHSGVVAGIQGGIGIISRLNALGIMPGKRIAKVSSMIGQGPITIEVDRVQVAIGFGMANRITVNVDHAK